MLISFRLVPSLSLGVLLTAVNALAQEAADSSPAPEPTPIPAPEPTPIAASADTPLANAPVSPPPEPPAEHEVVSCTWRQRACSYPHLVVSADAGFGHIAEGSPFGFQSGTGSATLYGPAWGLRVGAELTPWFAIEAHYIGAYNRARAFVSTGGRSSLITTAAAAELRFTAPTAYVQPYLFFGGGLYTTSVGGSADSTDLTGSTEFGIPLGVGFQVLLPRGVSVGAEMTYHRLFGESFSEIEDIGGGDPLTIDAVLRFRF